MASMTKQSAAVCRAMLHGWYLVNVGRDATFLEHSGGKVTGCICITIEGDVFYCPF